MSLDAGFFSPVLYLSEWPLLFLRYPSRSPYGKYSKTISRGSEDVNYLVICQENHYLNHVRMPRGGQSGQEKRPRNSFKNG